MRRAGVDTFITGSLVLESRRIAKLAGASVTYALMPIRVAELNQRSGGQRSKYSKRSTRPSPPGVERGTRYCAATQDAAVRAAVRREADRVGRLRSRPAARRTILVGMRGSTCRGFAGPKSPTREIIRFAEVA
jgi:hypothetical protein